MHAPQSPWRRSHAPHSCPPGRSHLPRRRPRVTSAAYQPPPYAARAAPAFPPVQQPYPPAQPVQQQPPQPQQYAPPRQPYAPPTDDVFLGRSQLVNKQVVTRTTGRSLGFISQMYVDTARLEVVYMDLKPSQLATETRANLLLTSLRQIGDVVLVHDDSVLYDEVYGEQWGYGKLVSAVVETEAGITLGRVRDFMFSPDSGRISAIKFDAFGLPLLPASLVKTYSLGVEWVVAADVSKVIVRAGAESAVVQETEGTIDSAITSVLNFFTTDPGVDEGVDRYMDEWVNDYQRWKAMYGDQYREATGMEPPSPTITRTTPQPLQLPQPSQTAYQQAFDLAQARSAEAAGRPLQDVLQPSATPAYQYQGQYQQQGQGPRTSRRQQRLQQQQYAPPQQQQQQYAPPQQQQQQQGMPVQPPLQQGDPMGQPSTRQGPGRAPLQDPRFRGTRPPTPTPTPTQPRAAALPPPQAQPVPPPASQGTVSIRAFDLPRDTREPYQRRDADGGYGPPPAAAQQAGMAPQQQAPVQPGTAPGAAAPLQPAPVRIDQWLEPARERAAASGVVDEDWWGR